MGNPFVNNPNVGGALRKNGKDKPMCDTCGREVDMEPIEGRYTPCPEPDCPGAVGPKP